MTRVDSLLAQVRLVLLGPKYAENIGAAVRVACNMGLGGLVVVGAPPAEPEAAARTATHHAGEMLAAIRYCRTLAEAVADCALVVATTARRGRQRLATIEPSQLAERLLPALASGPVALLFGPEDTGLANLDLAACGLVLSIPTAVEFSSLNLAQAVAIICYALRQGLLSLAAASGDGLYRPRPANPQELTAMLQAAASALKALDATADKEEAGPRLAHLRQVVGRGGLSAKEAKLLKDVCLQVARLIL